MEKYKYAPEVFESMEKSCVPFAVYQFIDKHVVTIVLSQGFLDLFGYADRKEAYEIMDNDMYRDSHPDDVSRIAEAAVRFAVDNEPYDVIYRTRSEGGYKVVHAQGSHVVMPDGTRLAYVWYTDEGPYDPEGKKGQSELNRTFSQSLHEDSLYHRNHYDYLTGVLTMSYFLELTDQAREKYKRMNRKAVMLFFDLCGMRLFNRKYGFAEGDKLIRAFSKVIAGMFGNDNCSRFGQDHFAVYTFRDDVEKKLNAVFEETKGINEGRTLPVRVGIYIYENSDIDASTACDRAKTACDMGRNTFISTFRYFESSMILKLEQRQYILSNIDTALKEKWIRVFYQPIIRAANGKVCEEEALARWIDPVRGMIMPGDFIPYLEDSRLIYKLDLYVLERVLVKMKSQADSGLFVVPQSINLSRADFDVCDIVEEVRQRVDAAGIGREKITIEITESTISQDFEFMKEQIERFHNLGFKVWMDDFGSGYSSLDLLQDIHFDLIKLDMRFMKQFGNSEKSRIILTELTKMAIGLGIETIAEGVERQEQVDFLKDIGCTKLQGFFFCGVIPPEEIVERNKKGIQIGFENPAEAEYYSSVGRINLYDLSSVRGEDMVFNQYFDTLPMAVVESCEGGARIIRCNNSYKDFLSRFHGEVSEGQAFSFSSRKTGQGPSLLKAMKQCITDGKRTMVTETMADEAVVHAFIRRIAVNPVTGSAAIVVVILAVMESLAGSNTDELIPTDSFVYALSVDYRNLYYVNLQTKQFIEYKPDETSGDLVIVRRGEDFFKACRRDAAEKLYIEDRERFIATFRRPILLDAIDQHSTFTFSYRLLVDGAPRYMNMKVSRIKDDDNHIIVGVSDVDAQMRAQEEYDRIKEEHATYSRIMALSGEFICIYTVDPVTDRYVEYSATTAYEGLGIPKAGEDFFGTSRERSSRVVYEDDRAKFMNIMTKENVKKAIDENGQFVLDYRLLIDGKPQYVSLRGAMIMENDGPQLVFGVINIDARVRREQEFARNLSVAREKADEDALTGVKNKNAYVEFEADLNRRIEAGEKVEFAVGVFDVNNLKQINDTYGHQTGDIYLKEACDTISSIFRHSPVFRIGGDEFAVICQGEDFRVLDSLMAKLQEVNERNARAKSIVVAAGMATYHGERTVAEVFERADVRMYGNKNSLKGIEHVRRV